MNERDGAETPFETKARAAFDASVARLDGATRSRLNQARQQALSEARRPGLRLPALWLPTGALATVAALALAVFLVGPGGLHHGSEAVAVEDAELLSAKDGLDLYTEDPEFFEWAGSAGHGAPPAADHG